MIHPTNYSSHSALKTVQFQNRLQAAQHIDTTPQATPQATLQHTTTKHTLTTMTNEDSPPPYKYDTLQLLFLTTHHKNIKAYDNEFTPYNISTYITKKRNNHRAHDEYLYQRWTNPTARSKKTRKTNQRNLVCSTTKDDTSVTPTLTTLSTLDTRSSHPTNIDTDTILSITIWNQPIAQYRIPPRPNTRNLSRHPSIAVQHALTGVYDKLIHPRKLPCLLYLSIY